MDLNKALNQVMNASQGGGGGNLWYPKDQGTTVIRPLPADPMIVNRMVHWGVAEKGPIRCTKDNPATYFAAAARALADAVKQGNKKAAFELNGFSKGHRAFSSVRPKQEFFMNIAKGGSHHVWTFNYAVQKALAEAIQELEALEVGAGRQKPNPFDPEKGHNLSVTKKEKGWSLKFDQIPSAIQLSGWQDQVVDLAKFEDAPEMTNEEIREALEEQYGGRLAKLGLSITTVAEMVEYGKEARENARQKYRNNGPSKSEGAEGEAQANSGGDPEPTALFRD